MIFLLATLKKLHSWFRCQFNEKLDLEFSKSGFKMNWRKNRIYQSIRLYNGF